MGSKQAPGQLIAKSKLSRALLFIGQSEFDNVQRLVLTAFGNEEMDKAIRAGAHRAMNKPVLVDWLMDEVRELLRESE
jgi:hypothetical protein